MEMNDEPCFRPETRDALRELLIESSGAVLVTGEAGVGKTWLVTEVCRGLIEEGAFAQHWILSVDDDVDSWDATIAAATGSVQMAEGPTLLCLDTVVAPMETPGWVASRRPRLPSTQLVILSRRGFDAPHLGRFDVAPLAVPPGDALEGPAARYLLHRIARMGLAASEEAALAEMLRLLDGLPLAIDFAVPRLRVMRPSVLVHRLRRSRSMLTGSASSFDETLAQSWAVLDGERQHALTRLCVAASPFSLTTAEGLLGPKATAKLEALANDGWLRQGLRGLELLTSLGDYVRRQMSAERLTEAEVALAQTLAERRDEEAHRQREALLRRTAARTMLSGALAASALRLYAQPEPKALLDDGLEPSRRIDTAVLDAVLRASRGSGVQSDLLSQAWEARAVEAMRSARWADARAALERASHHGRDVQVIRAHLELLCGHPEAATRRAGEARALYAAAGDESSELAALAVMAKAQHHLGAFADAGTLWDRVEARAQPSWADAARLRGAWAHLERGEHDAAQLRLDAIEQLEGASSCLTAWLAHDRGDLATAERHYLAALGTEGLVQAMALIGWGLLKLGGGAAAEASALFRQARRATLRGDWVHFAMALERHADRDLPMALRSPWMPPPPGPVGTPPHRLALRLTDGEGAWPEGLLSRFITGAADAVRDASPGLHVQPDGRWFQAPETPPVSLVRRPVVARVLAALVQFRREQSGAPASYDDLVEAGWPGERMRADAGAHRVRVAIATLRKQGLRPHLQTIEGGYRLDPDCPLVLRPD